MAKIEAVFSYGDIEHCHEVSSPILAHAKMDMVEYLTKQNPNADIQRIINAVSTLSRKGESQLFGWWTIIIVEV